MTNPPSIEQLFDSDRLVLASSDIDEVKDVCAKMVRPHAFQVHGTEPTLATRLYHLPLGSSSLNRLHHGTEVTSASVVPEVDNYIVAMTKVGTANLRHGNESTVVRPGHGSIVGPYELYRCDMDADFDHILLRLDRQKVETICARLLGLNKPSPVHFDLPLHCTSYYWQSLLEASAGIILTNEAMAHPMLLSHLEELLIETLLLSQPNNFSERIAAGARPTPSAHVRRAMEYMLEHISEPLRISAVALHCGISPRSLQLGFQRDVGLSPQQWLKAERLSRVYADLLAAEPGSVSITDLAMRWGFFHLGEFGAQFKARYALKPSEVLAKSRVSRLNPR